MGGWISDYISVQRERRYDMQISFFLFNFIYSLGEFSSRHSIVFLKRNSAPSLQKELLTLSVHTQSQGTCFISDPLLIWTHPYKRQFTHTFTVTVKVVKVCVNYRL